MSRRLLTSILIASLLLGGVSTRAEVVGSYAAGATAPDPATAGGGTWTLNNPGTINGTTVISAAQVPDGATGLNAWRMLDNSTTGSAFAYWSRSLTTTQLTSAATYGWRLSANVRVVDPVAANSGTLSTVLLYGDNAGKRWILFFDIDASGNLTAQLTGSTTITVATGASATAYHLHEMVYNPATATVEYFVDGVSKATAYAGTTGTYNGVQWGNGSSAGRGDGYWNTVTLTITDPPPVPQPPVVTTQPQSQDIAAGASVTFSAAFSGTPVPDFQWYKNTLPVAGALAATLTLNNLSATDAGDYWCRATNANGFTETTTAALSVLQPGAELEISEFLAENSGGLRDADGSQEDWIELHNPATSAANLSGWWLTDDALVPQKWALPSQSLAAGGRLVVFASAKNRAVAGAELHTNFKIGNAAGGYLALVRTNGTTAQNFTGYPAQFADISFGRTAKQPALAKFFALPTPGTTNVDGQTDAKHEPSFTPLAGIFSGTQNTNIAPHALTLPGGTLRYTTNGHPPTFDSPTYSASLALSATTNLRSAVIHPGERYGATQTAAYIHLAASAASFTTPLPIVVLHNFGAGAVPGVGGYGPNNDGSNVVEVAKQTHALTILDAAAGSNSFASPVVTSSRAGVKLRGTSSFNFARKSYTLDTWGEFDEVGRDVALLGMPADSDWVLYAPNPTQFDDPLIHNSLIYELGRQSGYNAPRTRFVEVFLNTGGGDITLANSLGLYLLVEKPKRGRNRVDFNYLNSDGTAGGWMITSDRMDGLPPGSTIGSITPRHFHTAGPDGVLQTENDNVRGYQGPSGGSGVAPPRDDQPNFYHSFFNFDSPAGWGITAAQRAPIQTQLRAFDTALYGASYTNPTSGYAPHIDRANWAQALALYCFAKNQDAIVLSTYFLRETPASRIKVGPLWDFDRAFASNGTATSSTTWAHDRLYFPRLMSDPEFAQAYIDAWQAMRRGAFSNANMTALVDAQSAEITSDVAARSGTTTGQWATDLAALKTWLTDRAAALDTLYTSPSVFSQLGGNVLAGFSLTITAAAGSIYYTTNGTDPRAVGGGIVGTLYTGAIPITANTSVFARVKNGSAWSGATVATFYPPQDLQTLRVTEIYYNPPGAGAVDGDEFEFLELQNTGLVTLDLGGLSFSGITFTFPNGASLAPGAIILLARNQTQLAARFPGAVANGIYTGKLDNGGETLGLVQGGVSVWSFSYGTSGAWPLQPNNGGASLQRPDAAAIGYDAATWAAAAPTPGATLSVADSDGDGMPDYFETQHGITDANADADGDGATNGAEFNAGTNPRDNASVFRLTAAATTDAATLVLEFNAVSARSYSVQYRDSLGAGAWLKYYDVPAGPSSRSELINVPMNTSARFYRIVTPALVGTALLLPASGGDAVALDPIFSNSMVLQRDMALPVWGTAAAGHEVTVTFNGAAASTVADVTGRWLVKLPAQSASKTSRELKVLAGGQPRLTVSDVLVGEVWLCAGQSNMEFRCDQEATWATEQASAALPHVRLRNMGYAGQGVGAVGYSAAVVARQTPSQFYNASAWAACDATSVAPFSAAGYFFGKEIRNALDVPVGLINMSVGGSPAEAWMRRAVIPPSLTAAGWTTNNTALEAWCNTRATVQLGSLIGTAPGDDMGPNHAFKPAFLWDSGPARLVPFAIRGVIWYQGESNALSHIGEAGVANPKWRIDQHETLFPLLVNDWRKQWGQGDFPFLVCQLSGLNQATREYWPEFRDYQRRATALLPNMGLAVTSDIGNASNVHPTNKRDVGKRLARWAQKYMHGDTSVVACPLPTTATRNGSSVIVSFNDAGSALSTSNTTAPETFELAGSDGDFHPATATISGATVNVTSASVPTPTKVRYAWQPFTTANLVNSAGLPASTFLLNVAP